jgi:hypothetical protein
VAAFEFHGSFLALAVLPTGYICGTYTSHLTTIPCFPQVDHVLVCHTPTPSARSPSRLISTHCLISLDGSSVAPHLPTGCLEYQVQVTMPTWPSPFQYSTPPLPSAWIDTLSDCLRSNIFSPLPCWMPECCVSRLGSPLGLLPPLKELPSSQVVRSAMWLGSKPHSVHQVRPFLSSSHPALFHIHRDCGLVSHNHFLCLFHVFDVPHVSPFPI